MRTLVRLGMIVFALPAVLQAQQQGTIRGLVIDAQTRAPLVSVVVHIQSLGLGTLSDASGRYVLTGVPVGEHQVQAQSIGHRRSTQAVTVAAGQARELNFNLATDVLALDEIVVTGTAGQQQRRSQPAQVDVIRAADVVSAAPISNMRDLLQSRSAGVSVQSGGGSPGVGARIRIRGPVSLSLSNEPLVFVDGVRINGGLESTNREEMSSGDRGMDRAASRMNDIAPEDIQSIEIVKGSAAATLYGADASAGVINIITKRGQQGRFQQTLELEGNAVQPTWEPFDNYAKCTAAALNTAPLCAGKSVGDLISDNPLKRYNGVRTGQLRRLAWSGQGGTADYQYYASLSNNRETGSYPGELDKRTTGRLSFSWQAERRVSLKAGIGMSFSHNNMLPDGGLGTGVMVNGLLGNPLTVGILPNDGWQSTRNINDIVQQNNIVENVHQTPTMEITYNPYPWFSHRLILGGDFSRSEVSQFWNKNDRQLWGSDLNDGAVNETRRDIRNLTADYISNIRHSLGAEAQWALSLALGTQVVDKRTDLTFAEGRGLVTNAARAVSAAASRSGGQWFGQNRSIGYISQLEVSHRNRLHIQVGVRADQNSSFGEDIPIVYLPKFGVSYIVSDTRFWQESVPWVSTFRIRGAYGNTGRAPAAGVSLRTFSPAAYLDANGVIRTGMTLANPGNPNLKPERGTEIEVGAAVAVLDDRLGLDFTFYNRVTRDAMLPQGLAPSIGFGEDPLVNLGELRNSGMEFQLNADVVRGARFGWTVRAGLSTLENEVVSLGGARPTFGNQWFAEGFPAAAYFSYHLRRVDVANNRAILSDTMEMDGTIFPKVEGNVATSFTIGQNITLFASLDGKAGNIVWNRTVGYRDVSVPRSLGAVAPETLPAEERLKRFGPFVTESGRTIAQLEGAIQYWRERADNIQLREVSLTYNLPEALAGRIRARRASLTLSGRNLHVFTKYRGYSTETASLGSLDRRAWDATEFFQLPPGRRLGATFRVGF